MQSNCDSRLRDWDRVQDSQGRIFYINYVKKETSWHLPLEVPLPEEWQEMTDDNGYTFFADHKNQITTWMDPRLPFVSKQNPLRKRTIDLGAPREAALETRKSGEALVNDPNDNNTWMEKDQDAAFDTWPDMTLKNRSKEGPANRFIAPFFEREEPLSCRQCSSKFGVLRRRHHCRLCGYIHCSDCLAAKVRLPIPNATVTTTTESSLSRLQNVCIRCARNVTSGEYCSIVGLRYCLFQANQDPTSFTLEERVELIKQLAETFRSPRKESSGGMGPHRIAQLNDIQAAGGTLAFCELLVPLIDNWIATPNDELEMVICKTIEMLIALVMLVVEASSEKSSTDTAFCNSGTCKGILNLLQASYRASEQKVVELCTLKLMHHLLGWEACRQKFSEADCVHHLAQMLASTSDTANSRSNEICVLAVQCIREFLNSNMETTRQILILQGLKSLWNLLLQILGTSESSEKYMDNWYGVESTESIGVILETMSACLQYVCDDTSFDVMASSYLRDKLTLDDLSLAAAKSVVEDTSQKTWVFAQIPECAISYLISIIAYGNPSLTKSSVRVCRMISSVPALLRHIAKESSSESLVILLRMLDSFSMHREAKPPTTSSSVDHVADCCTASSLLANMCCSVYAQPGMGGHEGREAWMMFMVSMERYGGLVVVLRVMKDLPQAQQAKVALSDAELWSLQQNLIEIIHGFALTSEASYLHKLCGDQVSDADHSTGCLRPLGTFLTSNRFSGICADMILILLKKAPHIVSAWRNLCPDEETEHELLLFFKSWLVMQDDGARQRMAVQFYLLYFRAPASCRLAQESFPDSVLDVIFHLAVTLATRDIRLECLELLLESLTHLPKKHARMHEQLTEQACFVSLMQILCARRYTNIIDKRIRRYTSSSYLLSLPTVTFANLEAENHSQWVVLKCLRTVLPDDKILSSEASELETDSQPRMRAERLVRRMMDISVLQAFCTAFWNVLVRLSQDNPSDSEVESIGKWCEAIFDVLERILTLLSPASIAKRERHIVDLIRVIIYILVSRLMDENAPGTQSLASGIWRVIRTLFQQEDWRLRFATLLRKEVTCDTEEGTLFVHNTVIFIRLLLRQMAEPDWMDDCVLMLKQLLSEPLFHHQNPKNHAFLEQVLMRTNIGETLIKLVCEEQAKGDCDSHRLHLLLGTLELSLHCENICEAAVANLDTLGYFLKLYMDPSSPESLQEVAGVLLAGFSNSPDAFRRCLEQDSTDTLALTILRNLILTTSKDPESIPRQQQIAERIVRNLEASDSLTCPLWLKCLQEADLTLLIAIIEHASHIKVQEVAARKLLEIIKQAFKDTQERLMVITEQLSASSEWVSRILDLFFTFESDREMSATGLHTIVALVSLMRQSSTCDETDAKQAALIQYDYMERLAVEGAHALLFWLRNESTQHDIVTILFDVIHAETRRLFYKQIIPNGSANATEDVLFLINALAKQLDELHCEFWPHRSSGFIPNVVFSQFVAPICKCCVLLCECLHCMDEQNWVLSSAGELDGLVRVSSMLLDWVGVTDDLDENNAHALIVTILELLECQTCSLDLCRKLVHIDTIKVALQFLQKPNLKQELILQTLSLLKMLLIVDMNQFIECQGIELLLQMLLNAIQEHYDGGSRIAHKVMELFGFMYKHSRLCNRGDTLLWTNGQVITVVDNCVVALTDRLESVKIALSEDDEHAEVVEREAPWISVLGNLVLFVFKSWRKDMTPMLTESTIAKSRVYEFFKWIACVFRLASYREKLQWGHEEYREFMCTAIPVLELGLIRCHRWTTYEGIGSVLIKVLDTIASHADTTMDCENLDQLLSTTCAALISYFGRPNATQCKDLYENGHHALSVLQSIHRKIEITPRSSGTIATIFDLIATIFPHLAIHWGKELESSTLSAEKSQPYAWVLLWIMETLDVVLSDPSFQDLFTSTLNLLKVCCFVELLQKILLSSDYLPRVTLQLEKALSFNEKLVLKLLQILGKSTWEFSDSQFRRNGQTLDPLLRSDVCILVRCYHCQQTVTLSPLDIQNWTVDKVSKCSYCHLPIAAAIQADGGALSLSTESEDDASEEHGMVQEYSVLQSSSRNSIANVGALKPRFSSFNLLEPDAVVSEDGESLTSGNDVDTTDPIETVVADSKPTHSTVAITPTDREMVMTRCRHCKTILCAPKRNTYKCMKCFQTTWH
uniref:Uncharacterized protein AlNc14C6G829 n=1 Tax=Albugo laibachii Nc14 TaxID=890382 RepID=F0W153_9STRA|nr:conserved hypothetical protein [Albugo laibachii Nc14]|eukprot:CCA14778.1 conserved hypothetical protein [Albugo laibachii Nc14]